MRRPTAQKPVFRYTEQPKSAIKPEVHLLKNRNNTCYIHTSHLSLAIKTASNADTACNVDATVLNEERQSQKAFIYDSIYKPPGSSACKESACNVETPVQFLGWQDRLQEG